LLKALDFDLCFAIIYLVNIYEANEKAVTMPATNSNILSPPPVRPTESAFRELIRTLGLLERIQQTYFARFGLTGSQWGVLRNLHRAEHEGLAGMRLTDLSERLLIRPPSVTGVVDRLERAGLVLREGSPTDLRAKQVALTDKGRELVERVLLVHGKQIDSVLGGLSSGELMEFHRLLSLFRQHLEGLLARGTSASMG
jgi:DNA-binding MarR family transcriptional regulator